MPPWEEKKQVPQVPQPVQEVKQESQPLIITSDTDAYLIERQKSAPKSLGEIEVKSVDASHDRHPLTLPREVELLFKKRSFVARWINKDKRMIDRALDIRGWNLVNRTYFPELSKHLFSANGCIERGDAILGFMPLKQAEALREIPRQRSNERVKNLPIEKWKDGGESYYKPDLGAEKDGEVLTTGIQPD